jgi:CMD domain protein
MATDIIGLLVGITPGSKLAGVREKHPVARDNAQASYLALFEPVDVTDMSVLERTAVAMFVVDLHGQPDIAGFYDMSLERMEGGPALRAALMAELPHALANGPYGHFPSGPLTIDDLAGPSYHVSDSGHAALGRRLSAAFEHAHFLVFHPRDSSPEKLQALLDAGWSTTGVVTLSQLVSFLAFQIRVVAGLRVLATA